MMRIKKLTLTVVVALGSLHLGAQVMDRAARADFGMEYNTEAQANANNAKWVNLLRLDMSVPIVKGISFNAATLSTAQTDEQPLMDDLQGFSNIEAENIPLTLAVLSLDWETECTTLSVGIRNFNENYFVTDLTSFFTQSSHGIFPTISANFPIANYPLASLGMDFQWRMNAFSINASLYNGLGYKNFTGRENLFRFCPKSDGLFGALQLSHEADYGNSHIGAAMRGDSEATRAALWAYSELNLGDRTQLLAQCSYASGADVECDRHASLGLKHAFGKLEIGVAENFARFNLKSDGRQADRGINEWATELTARMPVMQHAVFQPVVHLCHIGGHAQFVGLIRLTVEL